MKINNIFNNIFKQNSTESFASFIYDEKKVDLRLCDMQKITDNRYIIQIDVLTVTLTLNLHKIDEAAYWLLNFSNNSSENTKQISKIKTLDINITTSSNTPLIFESLSGDNCNENNFVPFKTELNENKNFHIEPFAGRSSACTGFPYFDIHTDECTMICAIGWTGQWCLDAVGSDNDTILSAGLADVDFYLSPGETARSVSIFIQYTKGDVHCARKRFRSFTRKNYSPAKNRPDFQTPIAIQNFDRYFWTVPEWRTETMQLDHIEKAKNCNGFDTYWLDAAWFKNGFPCGVGNFSFDPGFKNGLKAISDKAHESGMKFMLWFEPERIYETSETQVNHPEFLIKYPADGIFTDENGIRIDTQNYLFNLGDEKALKWLSNTLIEFIRNNGVDIYRQDFNMDPLPYWKKADLPNKKGYTEIKYIEGLYKLWDNILGAFPDLFIDNCSSGGRRIDFEMCMRSVPLWRSDTGCAPASPERHTSEWNQNQTIALNRYLAYHSTSSWTHDAYSVRSAETSGIATNICFEDDGALTLLKTALSELNLFRPYFSGDFYAHSEPTLDENIAICYQYALEKSGLVYIFGREFYSDGNYSIIFAAVKAGKMYKLIIHNEDYSVEEVLISGDILLNGYELALGKHESKAIEYLEI